MPAKTKKKSSSTAKQTKPAAKSTKTAKTSSKTAAKTQETKKEHPLTKKYLHKEQEDFFSSNPNSRPLLIIFILLAVAAFIYIIQVQGLLSQLQLQ